MKKDLAMLDNFSKVGERVEFASRFVPNCKKLLDIGCESGLLWYFVKNRASKMYGIDNDYNSLKICRKKYFDVKFVDLDRNNIPYNQNLFDVITCLDVIEHIKDPNQLLREIYRVLSSSGILIISTPNIRFSDHLYKLLFQGKFPITSLDIKFYNGGHIHFFTYKDIRNLLVQNGFKVIQEEGLINKKERGWKGKILEFLIGKNLMNEFRSPGILLIAQKV